MLLDVEMPVVSGPEMAQAMFVHDVSLEEIPLILLSGILSLRHIAAMVGTPYFLSKPYTFHALTRLIARALAERTPPHPPAPKRVR